MTRRFENKISNSGMIITRNNAFWITTSYFVRNFFDTLVFKKLENNWENNLRETPFIFKTTYLTFAVDLIIAFQYWHYLDESIRKNNLSILLIILLVEAKFCRDCVQSLLCPNFLHAIRKIRPRVKGIKKKKERVSCEKRRRNTRKASELISPCDGFIASFDPNIECFLAYLSFTFSSLLLCPPPPSFRGGGFSKSAKL